MKAETLRELIHKVPFAPFGIRMDNGTSYPVAHPDYLFVVPGGEHVIVAEDTGRFHILDLPHIRSIALKGNSPPPRP